MAKMTHVYYSDKWPLAVMWIFTVLCSRRGSSLIFLYFQWGHRFSKLVIWVIWNSLTNHFVIQVWGALLHYADACSKVSVFSGFELFWLNPHVSVTNSHLTLLYPPPLSLCTCLPPYTPLSVHRKHHRYQWQQVRLVPPLWLLKNTCCYALLSYCRLWAEISKI